MSAVDHTQTHARARASPHTITHIRVWAVSTERAILVCCVCVVVLRWLSYCLLACLPACLLSCFAYSVCARRWQFFLSLSVFHSCQHSQLSSNSKADRAQSLKPNPIQRSTERVVVVRTVCVPVPAYTRATYAFDSTKLHMWNCILYKNGHNYTVGMHL